MWPDNETDVDLLGFDFLVDGLVVALTEPRLLPLTVGVLGDWGSGKSSLMSLACAELKVEAASGTRYVCVRFSPWQYEDYDDVKVALMTAVLAQVGKEAAGNEEQEAEVGRLKSFMQRFGRRSRRVVRGGVGLVPSAVPAVAHMIDPATDPTMVTLAQKGMEVVATGVAGRLADPTPPVDDQPVTDVEEFRTRFADLVKSLDQVAAVVVFIDDLDRCLPETVVDTFEAIRLLLGAPRTAFVVAANQKVVESAVDARYPELRGDGGGIGAQYLEKMLQLKIAVPALAVPEAVTYVNMLLAELHLPAGDFARVRVHVAGQRATHSLEVAFNLGTLGDLGLAVPPELATDLQWAAGLAPVLARGSRGNPRQIKRFLNMLELRRRSAKRKKVSLEPSVLAKLMLLEDQHFADFQQLFDWQVSAGGPSCPQLASAEALARAGADSGSADAAAAPTAVPETPTRSPSRATRSGSAARKAAPAVDEAVRAWALRESVATWLRLSPPLAEVDLRPYFTYSRDRLALDAVTIARLSAVQQRLLAELLASTDQVRRAGLRRLSMVDPRDRDPVVEALAAALLTTPDDAFVAVCETIDHLPAARDVLFRALDRLPAAAVPVRHVAVAARRLPTDDPRTAALLASWATCGRDDLAKMVGLTRRPGANPPGR